MAAARSAAALLLAMLAAGGALAQGEGDAAPRKPIPYAQLKRADRPAHARAIHRTPRSHAPPRLPAAAPPAALAGAVAPSSQDAYAPMAPAAGGTARSLPPPPARAGAPAPTRSAPPAPPMAPFDAAPLPASPPPAAQPAGARLALAAPLPAAEVEAFVDGAVAHGLQAEHGVGAAVAVVQNGQVVLEKGYGLASLDLPRPVDPRRTVFRLGSASQLLTWIEVLKQVDAGRLRLDAPAGAALPPALRLPAEGFTGPVRLGALLRHASGLEARELGRLYLRHPGDVSPLDVALRRDRPHRVRPAGALQSAGDYGAALAGAAAAHATGRPFDALIEGDLLGPGGLGSTTFREPRPERDDLPAPMAPALAARLAQGYGWTRGRLVARPFAFAGSLSPALSASTTADDMARLMMAELAGGAAPGGAALWSPAVAAALHAGPGPGDTAEGAALGRWRSRLPGGFTGLGQSGGAPGFRVRYLLVPELGLGVFVAVNSDAAAPLAQGLAPELVARFYAGPPAQAAAAPDPSRVAGAYLTTRRAYHGLEGFVDRLHGLVRVRADAAGGLDVSGSGVSGRWTPDAQGGFTDAQGRGLRFLGEHDGRAAALSVPGEGFAAERVGWLHRPIGLALAAGVATLAALLTLIGPFGRAGRPELRATGAQTAAAGVQLAAATLWLGALAAFAVFGWRTPDAASLMLRWPNPWLEAASWSALGATLLTGVQIGQLPGAWAEGRRLQGWRAGRKLRHTLTVVSFAAFAAVLAAWGALEPWSS